MTQAEPEPKSTSPASVVDSNPRIIWIALSLLIASLVITVFAALYLKADSEAVRTDQAFAKKTPVKKTVLVMLPYQIDLPVNVISTQAIREEFGAAADLKLEVYYEYLDLNRFSDPAYQQKIFDLYADKYKNKQINLVITVTERMLSLWLAQRAEILPNAPIVFFDITTEHLDALKLPSDVTGVSGVLDYTKSAQWILDKLPAVNEIVIVHGVGQADQEYIQPVQNLQEKMKGQIKLTDLSNLPLTEIEQRMADLPKSSVVFYALMFEDAAGVKYVPINVLRELTAVSNVPVISGYDALIGIGTIGGYMYSYDHQARDAAQISLRILRGEAAGAIPIIKDQSARFVFDHPALQRFDIPLSALPPDSIVKNRQYSVWDLYRLQIIAVIVVFVVLLLLLTFLSIVTRRLNSARLGLSRLNADLEFRVQERTIALSQTNHELELEIINRKLVENELRVTEEKFRLAFTVSPDMKMISRLQDGMFVTVNPGFSQVLGYTPEECIGKTSIELNIWDHPEDRLMLIEGLSKRGEVSELEVRFRAKNGDIIYGLMSAAVIDLNGVKHIINNTHDITDRKRAEEALQESEARFRAIFEQAAVGVALLDTKTGRYVRINQAYCDFLGYTSEEMMKTGFQKVTYPEDVQANLDCNAQLIAGQIQSFSLEKRYVRRDGTVVWGRLTGSPLWNPGETPQIFFHIAVVEDITERKQAEAELLLSELDLKEAQSIAHIGSWKWDVNSGEVFWSDEMFRIFGTDKNSYTGRVGDIAQKAMHPDDLYIVLPDNAANIGNAPFEYRIILPDGSIRHIWAKTGASVFDQKGNPTFLIGIAEDITDRKLVEELLRENENRFRSMFETHGAVMLLIEPTTGQVLNANYSAEKFYGYPRTHLCTMNISDINTLTPEELQVERQRAVTNKCNYFNFQHRLANGNIRRVEEYSSPLMQKGKPILFSLVHDVTERKQAEEKILVLNNDLEKLASTDGLTGINNHRSLLKLAEREFDIARRYQSMFSMMFFDIDNFKQINDTFGHVMGDLALIKTIQTVCAELRSADLIGRYGGDEFVILLPQTSAQDALPLAERILASIAAMRVDTLTLTISIGIAQSLHGTLQTDTVEEVLHRADLALYAAKQAGKNCTIIYG